MPGCLLVLCPWRLGALVSWCLPWLHLMIWGFTSFDTLAFGYTGSFACWFPDAFGLWCLSAWVHWFPGDLAHWHTGDASDNDDVDDSTGYTQHKTGNIITHHTPSCFRLCGLDMRHNINTLQLDKNTGFAVHHIIPDFL